jgi:hypothetical protein
MGPFQTKLYQLSESAERDMQAAIAHGAVHVVARLLKFAHLSN